MTIGNKAIPMKHVLVNDTTDGKMRIASQKFSVDGMIDSVGVTEIDGKYYQVGINHLQSSGDANEDANLIRNIFSSLEPK